MKATSQRAFAVVLGTCLAAACAGGTKGMGSVAAAGTSGASAGGGVPPSGGSGTSAGRGGAAGEAMSGGTANALAGSAGLAMTGGSDGAGESGGASGSDGLGGAAPGGPINVLVWNYTTGYGHQSRETAIPVLLQAAQGTDIHFDVQYALADVLPEGTSDTSAGKQPDTSAFVSGGLDKYDVIFFLNTTGSPLNADGAGMEKVHQQALRDYMEQAHRGFIGTHSATDTYQGNSWPWYVDDLIGANFAAHSNAGTSGTARWNDGVTHPILTGSAVPNPWSRQEEWYTFTRDVRDYAPSDGAGVFSALLLANDAQFPERPTAWVNQMTGGGRVFYSAFGHDVSAFKEPLFQKLLFTGIRWAAHRL